MNDIQLHTSTGVNLRNNVEWEKQLKEEYIEYDSVWKYEKKSILFRNTYRGGRTLREMISTKIMMVFTSAGGAAIKERCKEN